MKSLCKTLQLPAMLLIAGYLHAQGSKPSIQDSALAAQDSIKANKKNVFNTSINYVSRLNYLGRVDSLKSSGLFPIVGIESKTGLYANGTFIFTQNSAQPLTYAGTSIEGGYKFPESKHFSGNRNHC